MAEKNLQAGKVAVIIPVYKTEKYVRDSIQSVLDQDYGEMEVILVDDGSPDGCPRICDKIAIENNHIKVIHKENGGQSSARNAGLEAVSPETAYVLFLDSDDRLADGAIEGLVGMAQDTGADIVIPDRYIKVFEASGRKSTALHFPEDMYDSDPLHFALDVLMEQGRAWRAHSLLYSFSAIQRAGARFPEGKIAEDFTFNLLMLSSVEKISFYPYPTVFYLKRKGSTTTTFHPDFEEDIWYMDIQAREFLARTGWDNFIGREKADALLCRNIVVYLFSIMSSKNKMTYREKVGKAAGLLRHPNARGAVRRKHKIPYFASRKSQMGISLVYVLLRYRQDPLVFILLSILAKWKGGI